VTSGPTNNRKPGQTPDLRSWVYLTNGPDERIHELETLSAEAVEHAEGWTTR
jgi:hypothetical protein